MKMHATMLASNPPFCYFEPESDLSPQQTIRTIREERGIPAYFTMDAGPNVKVYLQSKMIFQRLWKNLAKYSRVKNSSLRFQEKVFAR